MQQLLSDQRQSSAGVLLCMDFVACLWSDPGADVLPSEEILHKDVLGAEDGPLHHPDRS